MKQIVESKLMNATKKKGTDIAKVVKLTLNEHVV